MTAVQIAKHFFAFRFVLRLAFVIIRLLHFYCLFSQGLEAGNSCDNLLEVLSLSSISLGFLFNLLIFEEAGELLAFEVFLIHILVHIVDPQLVTAFIRHFFIFIVQIVFVLYLYLNAIL